MWKEKSHTLSLPYHRILVTQRHATLIVKDIAECYCYEIEPTSNYSLTEFRDDIKKAYYMAGIELIQPLKKQSLIYFTGVTSRSVTLLITDRAIVNESFLEDISCILSSGEIPNLYDAYPI